jgi:hypothetical protein
MSIVRINDYGISWDEPIHWLRGHAYLHYFLTGKLDYQDLPQIKEHFQNHDDIPPHSGAVSLTDFRRSYYQSDSLTGKWFLENDGGHPVINDIGAAITNYIFYQRLGMVGDVAGHHVFNIFASALLVFIVALFAYQTYGKLAAVISSLSLISYPLFLGESQFNIKDPPQAAFFALCIWSFWYALQTRRARWLILSAISFGLSFGMKFNILFVPFILGAFSLIHFWPLKISSLRKIPKSFYVAAFAAPVIIAVIFFVPWPYLWADPISNFLNIFKYYKEIGTGSYYTGRFVGPFGLHLYPLLWILMTTYPLVLILTLIGILFGLREWRAGNKAAILWILWLVIPLARVMYPGASIYGGIRQIFEYIPAMALLAGLGAHALSTRLPKAIVLLCILVLFLPHLVTMARMHPHENVYFNSLIGGLEGAKKANIPYYGNSFGNAYKSALDWLNENAEPDAKLGLVQGTGLNMPRIMIRPDIRYWNDYWTGIDRGGEYMLELTHDDPVKAYPYAWEYVEKTLKPVHEVKVDGVAIAKVWKNDKEHSFPEYQRDEREYRGNLDVTKLGNVLTISTSTVTDITRVQINYDSTKCELPKGSVFTSLDGKTWALEKENIPFPQVSKVKPVDERRLLYFFPIRRAKAVRIETAADSCLQKATSIELYELQQ